MYALIASDLDGTLLSSQHEIPPFSQNILRQLADKGLQFAFATGRHFVDVCHLQRQLDMPCWMISSNGAQVHDDQGQLVYQACLDDELAKAIMQLPEASSCSINLYQPEHWFTNTPAVVAYSMAKASGFHAQRFELATPPLADVLKLFFLGEPADLQQLEQAILARFSDQVSLSFSMADCLEVMALGVSKGHALELILQSQDLHLSQCMAFGDGMNDLEILSRVGKGLLMQNSHQRLKDALPHLEVIGHHQDEAVAKYLLAQVLTA